jgi:flagellar operon protein
VGEVQAVRPAGPVIERARHRETRVSEAGDFTQILQEKISGTALRFSQHALARLQSREIEHAPQDLDRLRGAVSLAAAKGAKESLVLMDDLALVVSVTNQTVITALKGAEKKERVFTNIDSAVII